MRWLSLLVLLNLAKIQCASGRELVSNDHYRVTYDHAGEVWPWRSYKSSPHTPPEMRITRHGSRGELSEGYVFLAPTDADRNHGTHVSGIGYIMMSEGDLVFAAEETGMDFCGEWIGGMTDFRVQTYNGKPHITFWNGCNHFNRHWGHRWGKVTFVDEQYETFTINPNLYIDSADDANDGQIDLHEHEMTDRNTMLVSSYSSQQWDLSSIGGPVDGWIYDSFFFEINIQTEEVLFKWKALDHLPLNLSKASFLHSEIGTKKKHLDWFHINSVQAVGEDYIVSSFGLSTIYMISGRNGSVLWQLKGAYGGSLNDGKDSNSLTSLPTGFSIQHHVRAHNVSEHGMTVSFFNNNWGKDSHALAFYIPLPVHPQSPPTLVRRLRDHSSPVGSATMGSCQMDLGNGNGLVGYGRMPIVREYAPVEHGNLASEILWEAQFGYENAVQSYRTMKGRWHGTPKSWDPAVVIEEVRKSILPPRVYVSWNGATDISHWSVYAGRDSNTLKQIGVAEKKGFETSFDLDSECMCVRLGAIRAGEVIRWSNIACLEGCTQDAWTFHTAAFAVGCMVIIILAGPWWYCRRRDRHRCDPTQRVPSMESGRRNQHTLEEAARLLAECDEATKK